MKILILSIILVHVGFFTFAQQNAQLRNEHLLLSRMEESIKNGLTLTEEQSDVFFKLDRERSRLVDSIYFNFKGNGDDLGKKRSEKIKSVQRDFRIRMKALLDPSQLQRYDSLLEAMRKRSDKRMEAINHRRGISAGSK
ncbi:hypothetical protein [Sphingobacterium sp. UBA7038]|uniref:hypothetical protein n=1 Tax=Sphingobacterium TaxID=28453 RepID=UPI000E87F039|nr:hypothetical protein [Sphingobacterium sp. UBA7038]HAT92959.1 hypothetical protein [Sphingobacterium sp.]